MFCSELLDRILLLYIENLQMIYFCTRGNFTFSIVKQQHHGRFPPGRVGVPLVTRIPLSNLIPHHFILLCTSRKLMERKQTITQKKYYSFQQLLFQLSYSAEKQKAAGRRITKKSKKKPKRLRHQKNHLSHPSVIEKSIKRVQNRDVRKSQRKSRNQIVFFTSSDVISA